MRTIRHTAAADSDLQSILEWMLESFGRPAMARYSRLIGRALLDLADDPERPGSQHAVDALSSQHDRRILPRT
jgi:plasmid stabilization system protein ParE